MKKILSCLILCAGLSACTTAPANSGDKFEAQDPIKPFNESVFAFNLAADEYAIRPIAQAYHELPLWARGGIGNFLTNLGEPANAVNGVLQLNPQIALTSFWRFALNTTFGFAGVRDFAGENGLKIKKTDFSQTLGRYGVADGAYVVLPIAGPSTARGTAGTAVDWFLDPVGWVLTTPESIAQVAANGIATRDDSGKIIDQLYYDSLEPYSATRAAYLQHQAFQ